MKKHIIAIIGFIVVLIMIFTACTAGNGDETANGTTAPSETVSTVLNEESTSEVTTAESTTEKTTESSTEQTSKAQTTEKKTEPKQTTTKKVQSTQKQTTTKKAQAQTTEKVKQTTTTKKQTTTKKVTTTEDEWDCRVDGHTSKAGQIGWVNSYEEAAKKARKYIDQNADSGGYRIEQCHMCGKYTAYITLD